MKQNLERINVWLQILVLVTIPLEPKVLNNVSIILWGVSTVFSIDKVRLKEHGWRFVAPFLIYFVVLVAGWLYGPDPFSREGGSFFETRVTMLIVPVLLLLSKPVDLDKAMRWFVAVCITLCLVCVVGAIVKNLDYNNFHHLPTLEINPWFFTYYLYTDHVHLHPTYFAMFLMIAIVYLSGWRGDKPVPWYSWVIVLFLVANVVALMSRMVLAIMVAYFAVYLFFGFAGTLKRKLAVAGGGLLILVLMLMNPVAQQRMKDIFDNDKSLFSGSNLKLDMWRALYSDIISKNVLLGIGPINQDETIREVYKRHDLTEPYEYNFNSHNQYVEAWVHHGLIGMLSLIFLYCFYLWYGAKKGNYLLIVAVTLMIITSLTESLLLRQKGILFMSFIVPFLAFNFQPSHMREKRLESQ